jgi:CubicO group peptidase (beta-lactamase class C family)
MKARLLDPLDMSNSSVDMEFIRQHPNRAIGHTPHIERETLEMPMIGAGGVYTGARDLAKFVQFHLNWGKVGGNSVLKKKLVESMSTSLPGLGIGAYLRHVSAERYPSVDPNTLNFCLLDHGGGGFGFSTYMGWVPEYGIGVLALSNSITDRSGVGSRSVYRIVEDLIVKESIKREYVNPEWKTIIAENKYHPTYEEPDSDTFTPYKPEWKKYTGTYKYLHDWNLYPYARTALALGYRHPGLTEKVYEEDGYLKIAGKRLDEYQPGVFFNKKGDCLDFTGPTPLWKGMRIKKK